MATHKHWNSVVLLAPTNKDAALTESIFEQAGLVYVSCTSLEQVCQQMDAGAGAVLLAEELIKEVQSGCLIEWLRHQPQWSDLPVLVVARPGADSAAVAQAVDRLGNVTVLERPIRVATFVSSIRTAIRRGSGNTKFAIKLPSGKATSNRKLASVPLSRRRMTPLSAKLCRESSNPGTRARSDCSGIQRPKRSVARSPC